MLSSLLFIIFIIPVICHIALRLLSKTQCDVEESGGVGQMDGTSTFSDTLPVFTIKSHSSFQRAAILGRGHADYLFEEFGEIVNVQDANAGGDILNMHGH